MSKQANKTMIGVFVIGALVLAVAGILIFGSGKFLKEEVPFVMCFEGSVKGLDEGASVNFRGVKVGTVTDIVLRSDTTTLSVAISVYIELEPDRWRRTGEKVDRDLKKGMRLLIEKGLRAQLEMQSMVTGKLLVELDFHPDEPPKLYNVDPGYVEIPTVQGDLAALAEKIEKAPIEEILEKLHSAVSGIEKVVNSPEIMSVVQNLDMSLVAARELLEKVDNQVQPLSSSAEKTMRDARKLLQNVDTQVEPLANRLTGAIESADSAVKQAEKTLLAVEGVVGDDSEVIYDLSQVTEELSSAARSIRILADYLAQHPESLLRGKGGAQ